MAPLIDRSYLVYLSKWSGKVARLAPRHFYIELELLEVNMESPSVYSKHHIHLIEQKLLTPPVITLVILSHTSHTTT